MTGPTRAPATLVERLAMVDAGFAAVPIPEMTGDLAWQVWAEALEDVQPFADAALDWVTEQLADPEVVEVAWNAHEDSVPRPDDFVQEGRERAIADALTAALAALRDRAASPAEES